MRIRSETLFADISVYAHSVWRSLLRGAGDRSTVQGELAIGVLEFALLALVGVGVGTYGTLVGLGGGFLVVPLLLIIYNLSPPAAAATSLAVVVLNAASGSLSYFRSGRIDIGTGLVLAGGSIPGAFVGPWVAERTPERAFKLAFALFLLVMAVVLYRRSERPAHPGPHSRGGVGRIRRKFTDRSGMSFEYSYSLPLALAIAFVAGVLSSMFGIGGGTVHVPAMIHLMAFPVHIATATSFFVLAITALAGTLEYARRGYILWPLAAALGAGVILGAQLGAWLSHRTRGRRILKLLGLAIVALALRLFWAGLRGE